MKRVFILIAAAGLTGACKKPPRTGAHRDAKPAKTLERPKGKDAARPPSKGTAASSEAPIALFKPLPFQPDRKVYAGTIEPLGWTRDSRRFVIQVRRGRYVGGSEIFAEVALKEVYDALTERLVDAYRVYRDVPEMSGGLKKAEQRSWRQAKPAKAWRAFDAANGIVGGCQSRVSPNKRWTLSVAPVRVPRSFRVKGTAHGAFYTYGSGFPKVAVKLSAGAVSWPVLRYTLGAPNEPGYMGEGTVGACWSPDSRRVLLVLEEIVGQAHKGRVANIEESRDMRFYARAVGPQIQISHTPAAEARAHQLARRLGAAGLPVVRLSPTKKAPLRDEVYYRRDHEALAKRAAAIVAEKTPAKPLKSAGWLDLVILLK